MIKHSLVPDVEHSVRFEYLLETMRSESAQCDGKKTKRNCNPKKENRHLAISSGVNASPTAFLDHSRPIVGSGESFSNGKSLNQQRRNTLLVSSLALFRKPQLRSQRLRSPRQCCRRL